MLPGRVVVAPVLALGAVCLMGIILPGGCPRQQMPGTPTVEEPNTPVQPNETGQGTTDRPIPGPPTEPNEPNTAPASGGDTSGNGTSDTGGGGAATFSVRWNAPLTPLAVRPGTSIALTFKLSDTQGIVNSAELAVARDNNQDGEPDSTNPVALKAISVSPGTNMITYDTNQARPLLSNGFGRFLLGLRLHSSLGEVQTTYAPGRVTIDGEAPTVTWLFPTAEALVNPQDWQVKLETTDNSEHTVRVVLDDNMSPADGYAGILIGDTSFGPGTSTLNRTVPLSIAPGTYYYYVIVSDGIDPPTTLYAKAGDGTTDLRLMLTNRLIGTFDLNRLAQGRASGASEGAIFQGFNFNDLAGSSMAGVPDLTEDGRSELLIASRFGKPKLVSTDGIGWGEAYMIYGSDSRLSGTWQLNSVGRGAVPGLVFPGIRAPVGTTWTEGLSDVTVIPDMDGDDKPELVFSFPRVESVSLRNRSPGIQHPELFPDLPGMGELEYDAYEHYDPQTGDSYYWETNTAQFTRGGIVIVSSHSPMLQNPQRLNRKGDRIVDLTEVGQMFDDMGMPRWFNFLWSGGSESLSTVCLDPNDPNAAPKDQTYASWTFIHDIAFEDQGPGGFDNYFSAPQLFGIPLDDPQAPAGVRWEPDPFEPPLANIRPFDAFPMPEDPNGFPLTFGDPCTAPNCVWTNLWRRWWAFPVDNVDTSSLPDPRMYGARSWHGSWIGEQSGLMVWTGFCGWGSARVVPLSGGNECGARVLGQRREDRFGTAVGADGNYLYISAPQRDALKAGDNVPELDADRLGSGVVYQLRTNAHPNGATYTVTQLWIEPGVQVLMDPNDPNYPTDPNDPNTPVPLVDAAFPHIDAENGERTDPSMPTPHQYIIETVGSTRSDDRYWEELALFDPPRMQQPPAGYPEREWLVDYSFGAAGCAGAQQEYVDWTLGVPANTVNGSPYWPHPNAQQSDYYVDRTNQIVGPHRFAYLSAVRGLGDVNGDGNPDFAVGSKNVSESFDNPQNPTGPTVGAVFIVFGRQTGLEGDYLLDRMALATNATGRVHGVLLRGTTADEQMGRVFDDAGDFDGDGVSDVVVGAAGYDANRGQAVVILGSATLESPAGGWTVDDILVAGRGVRFTGGAAGDLAGANVAGAGDVDGDGRGDILIAAPGAAGGQGAVYLIYGAPGLGGQELSLSQVGTLALPGVKFLGRGATDQLGGGQVEYPGSAGIYLNPNSNPSTIYSRGVVSLGDIDGDGYADFAISAMLANPNGRVRAGEVYILYGRGDR